MGKAKRNIPQVIRSLNVLISRREKLHGEKKLKVESAMLIEGGGFRKVMKNVCG